MIVFGSVVISKTNTTEIVPTKERYHGKNA